MTIQSQIKKLIKKGKEASFLPAVPVTNRDAFRMKPKPRVKTKPVATIPVHQHLWKIVAKTYAPPSNIIGGELNMTESVMSKAMFGVTTLLWECPCGETKKEELLGSDEDLLESVIDKADKIGPQFIERRGKSYIISEWKPQPQGQGMIPLK